MVSFELLINNLCEAVFLFDKKGRLLFANKAAEEFFGRSLKEIRLKGFKVLFAGSKDIVVFIKKTLTEGRLFNGRDIEINIGKSATVDLKISPFYAAGSLEGAILSIRENLELTEKEDYNFDSFLYMIGSVAHEIKNPLSGIKGAAQILKGTAVGADDLECIDLILKETDRLNSVLLSYLSMTRKPAFNHINIHEVVEHSLKVMGPAIKGKKITVEKLYDPSLPIISGDEIKLLQVFINLLKNAVEAMEAAKDARLNISTGLSNEYMVIYKNRGANVEETKKQRWVVVDIRDTGSGIPKNEIKKVFLPFYTKKTGGSGLGLSLSQKIVRDHGGIIKVKSEPGKGTSFRVYLPF